MSYEIPNNMLVNAINACDLLWEYNGMNFTDMTGTPPNVGVKNLSNYSIIYLETMSLNGRHGVHILVNDQSIEYPYVLDECSDSLVDKWYRNVYVRGNRLSFTLAYDCDGLNDTSITHCCPIRIYGIR